MTRVGTDDWRVVWRSTLARRAIARIARASPSTGAANRAQFPDWANAPVASFGDYDARLSIVGLAPGLRGANRRAPVHRRLCGRSALCTLLEFGFAGGVYDRRPDDGLRSSIALSSTPCVASLRRTTDPAEIATCRPLSTPAISGLPRLRVMPPWGGSRMRARSRLELSLASFPSPMARVTNCGLPPASSTAIIARATTPILAC